MITVSALFGSVHCTLNPSLGLAGGARYKLKDVQANGRSLKTRPGGESRGSTERNGSSGNQTWRFFCKSSVYTPSVGKFRDRYLLEATA